MSQWRNHRENLPILITIVLCLQLVTLIMVLSTAQVATKAEKYIKDFILGGGEPYEIRRMLRQAEEAKVEADNTRVIPDESDESSGDESDECARSAKTLLTPQLIQRRRFADDTSGDEEGPDPEEILLASLQNTPKANPVTKLRGTRASAVGRTASGGTSKPSAKQPESPYQSLKKVLKDSPGHHVPVTSPAPGPGQTRTRKRKRQAAVSTPAGKSTRKTMKIKKPDDSDDSFGLE